MKVVTLAVAAVLGVSGATAFAYDYRNDERHVAYYSTSRDSLERRIDHLNRMLNHVRWELRRYHAGWQTRRDVDDIGRQVDRVNSRFRHGTFRRSGLSQEVDRLRDRLRAVEERLHVRRGDYYRWD